MKIGSKNAIFTYILGCICLFEILSLFEWFDVKFSKDKILSVNIHGVVRSSISMYIYYMYFRNNIVQLFFWYKTFICSWSSAQTIKEVFNITEYYVCGYLMQKYWNAIFIEFTTSDFFYSVCILLSSQHIYPMYKYIDIQNCVSRKTMIK